MQTEPEILFEGRQHPAFLDEVAALPEGERIRACIQCGTCGGTCPVSPYLPHTPRRVFAMVRAGMKDQVLKSLTPWVCSSCYECTVKCPAQIKITEIMYALKRRAIREGTTPEDSDAYRFFKLFEQIVAKKGRAHELKLLMKYMLFRHTGQMMRQSMFGARMIFKGRMPLFGHSIKDKDGFEKLVRKAIELGEQEGAA